jgi:hypothetical protein
VQKEELESASSIDSGTFAQRNIGTMCGGGGGNAIVAHRSLEIEQPVVNPQISSRAPSRQR